MAQKHDLQYLDFVEYVLKNGHVKTDRTGTGTISVSSYQMRFDLSDDSVPVLTTKKMFTRGMREEILWYFRGETNINSLLEKGIHIWDQWATATGDLGPVYGAMWRHWTDKEVIVTSELEGYRERGYMHMGNLAINGEIDTNIHIVQKVIDQLADAILLLKHNPDSRRIIINSWHPALLPIRPVPKDNPEIGLQALPPCHCMFQFTVLDGKLNCDLRQRSADIGLGVPFNIAQYSIITHLIAKMVGLKPGEFVWNGVDCHIYSNHVDQLKLQLSRRDQEVPDSPTVRISDRVRDILPEQVEMDDMEIVGYATSYDKLEMGVAT